MALLMVVPWIVVALAGVQSQAPNLPAPSTTPTVDRPPIIALTEGDGYTFDAGSADLSESFQDALDRLVAPAILEAAERYQCDVVEVVGHTDGQPVNRKSGLDTASMADTDFLGRALAGSNADLGLMRAWAVRRQLRTRTELKHLKFRALSGANLTLPNGDDADWRDRTDVQERRRIEIRLRRSVGTLRAAPARNAAK
ncbi:MAG: hypothetical protein IPP20_11155 [Gemmatimonadetes bacterium]|nr:hypothetical protein [Gemmatimonadota bacterium]